MTEEALAWGGPESPVKAAELSFAEMKFQGDPAKPVDAREMRRQAGALGRLAAQPELAEEFGLVSPIAPGFSREEYDLPRVESVRSARRIGPDKQVAFDTVAEIVQVRHARLGDGRRFDFLGGSTVILGPAGDIRFIVRKRVDHRERLQLQREFMSGPEGLRFWEEQGGRLRPAADIARRFCIR